MIISMLKQINNKQECEFASLQTDCGPSYDSRSVFAFHNIGHSARRHLVELTGCFRPQAEVSDYFVAWLDNGQHAATAVI